MLIKHILTNFVQEVYPGFLDQYKARLITLDKFKEELIGAFSTMESWDVDEVGFPCLKKAIIVQIYQIICAKREFIPEEDSLNEEGEFVLTDLFKNKPSYGQNALIIDTGVEKRLVSEMIRDIRWIVMHVEHALDEVKDGCFIMEVTSNPIKEAFCRDITEMSGNLIEKSRKNR